MKNIQVSKNNSKFKMQIKLIVLTAEYFSNLFKEN